MRQFAISLVGIALLLSVSFHAGRARTPDVTWTPVVPVEGTIIRILIRPDSSASAADRILAADGTLAGQQLHFEPKADGTFHALAGVPVGDADSIKVGLRFEDARGRSEHLELYMPVSQASFSVSTLRVDPRFVDPPDSALAVRIAAERDSLRRVVQASHTTPRMWERSFIRPRTTRVTSAFGQRREFNGEFRSRHWGTDLQGATGSTVVSANRGIVALVGNYYYSGGFVYIDHGRGLLTAYMHLSRMDVATGDTVARGQVIGGVGATGRVTGPHLHWTARYGEVPVDPLSLLDVDLRAFSAAAPDGASSR